MLMGLFWLFPRMYWLSGESSSSHSGSVSAREDPLFPALGPTLASDGASGLLGALGSVLDTFESLDLRSLVGVSGLRSLAPASPSLGSVFA
jgi:hypothetical protein